MHARNKRSKFPLHVLVVEDDYLQSKKISYGIQNEGGIVVGPFSNIYEAKKYAIDSDAAILNVEIGRGNPFLLADHLGEISVPFVFLTGYNKEIIPNRFKRCHIYKKPFSTTLLLDDLNQQRQDLENTGLIDIKKIVLELILIAREMMPDQSAAERLVEGVMHQAIAKANNGTFESDARQQLKTLLREEYRLRKIKYFN